MISIFKKELTPLKGSTIIEKAMFYKDMLEKLKSQNAKYYYKTLYTEDSIAQIYRYIRLLELTQNFQELVNSKSISFSTAIHISYLDIPTQNLLYTVIKDNNYHINANQAKQLRTISCNDENKIHSILDTTSKNKFTGKITQANLQKLASRFKNDYEFNQFIKYEI